jgi:hypothetical protein
LLLKREDFGNIAHEAEKYLIREKAHKKTALLPTEGNKAVSFRPNSLSTN